MNEASEREAFEAWARDFGFPSVQRHPTAPGRCYTDRSLTLAWEGWKARAAVPAAIYEQRLRQVLDVVQRHLPPDGISSFKAMNEIIGLVDPWPVAAPQARQEQPDSVHLTEPKGGEAATARDAALYRKLMALPGARRRIWNHVLDEETKGSHDSIEAALSSTPGDGGTGGVPASPNDHLKDPK